MFRCFDFTLFLVNNKQDSTVSVIKLNCDNTIESKHDYDLWKKYSILFLGLNSYNCWKDTAIELSPDQWPNTFTIIKFQNNILDSSVTFEDQWVQSYYFDSTRYANDLAINYAKSVYRVQESKILSQLTYDLVWGELKNVR
ncbi:MAG: hypothetical protein K1X91_10495 [Bacteriodetes bacterium]|nr:hypothetical protein [Bacteroidota bacterium]